MNVWNGKGPQEFRAPGYADPSVSIPVTAKPSDAPGTPPKPAPPVADASAMRWKAYCDCRMQHFAAGR